jgi:hypothetical protein
LALPVLLSIIISLWVTVVYVSTGTALLRFLGWQGRTTLERLVIGTAIGFGIVGNLITLLNFLQCARVEIIIGLLAVLSVLSLPLWKHVPGLLRLLPLSIPRSRELIALLLLAFLLMLYFFRTLLPPSGFDALMYHLSSARLYLEHHGFYNVFFNAQSHFPMLTEMNFMIGMAAGNDSVCRQIDFVTGLLACGALALFSGKCGLNRTMTMLGCILFLTMTVVIAAYTGCDVDLSMAAWIALAIYCAMEERDHKTPGALILAALFTGMALQTKIFGVFAVPVVLLAAGMPKRETWKKHAILMVTPLLMALPWYAKSYLFTGSILAIPGTMIKDQGLGLPMGIAAASPLINILINVPLRIVSAPWTFSLMPSLHQQEMLGPLFIMLLPFAFVVALSGMSKRLIWLSAVYLAEVLFMEMVFIPGGASIRYTLVIPLLLIPVVVRIVSDLRRAWPVAGRIVTALLLLQIAFGTLLLVKRYHRDWIALVQLKSRTGYYESILPQYPAINYVNNLPQGAKVLTIFNYDNYLVTIPYIAAYRSWNNRDTLLADLARYRITHILANNVFDTASNRTAFGVFDEQQLVFSRNGFRVFAVEPE